MQKISIPMIGGMHVVTPNPWLIICQYLAVLVVTVIVALIVARYAAHHWQGNKKDVATGYAAISGAYALLLFGGFGFTAQTIRGILLCIILLTASYSDLKSREVADYMSVMVLLTAFIGVSMVDIPGMLMGGLFVSGMMILVTLLSGESCIGGADIKLGGACAFALGTTGGIAGLIGGLVLAIVINMCRGKSTRNQGFPLVPYLAAGFLAAYFI